MGHLSDDVATANSPLTSVLLVQPERDDREKYQAFLRYRRFRPVVVSIAVDALRVASRADVIVTGILLPGSMDGIELVRRLKTDHRTRRIPTIVLTACVAARSSAGMGGGLRRVLGEAVSAGSAHRRNPACDERSISSTNVSVVQVTVSGCCSRPNRKEGVMKARVTSRDVPATAADGAVRAPEEATAPLADRDIAQRAYQLYLARDRRDGYDVEDWLQAEQELRLAAPAREE